MKDPLCLSVLDHGMLFNFMAQYISTSFVVLVLLILEWRVLRQNVLHSEVFCLLYVSHSLHVMSVEFAGCVGGCHVEQ